MQQSARRDLQESLHRHPKCLQKSPGTQRSAHAKICSLLRAQCGWTSTRKSADCRQYIYSEEEGQIADCTCPGETNARI